MIPKPLYEALPFVYFSSGSMLWLLSDSPLLILAGILLFVASTMQWIMRSNYRRSDRINANLVGSNFKVHVTKLEERRVVLPKQLYEMLPFLYIAAGYVVISALRFMPDSAVQMRLDLSIMAATCLCLAGFIVLALRNAHRQKPTAKAEI